MSVLQTSFLNFKLTNPVVLASGILGTSASLLRRCAVSGAGAVTAKSCGLTPRTGHPNPVTFDWGAGVINAIGLSNPGVAEEIKLLRTAKKNLAPLQTPLFASIFAATVEEYYEVVRQVAEAEPDLIEVNISCPNVADEFGTPFAASCESAAAVTAACRKATNIPLSIKLAPNVPSIGRIARAVEEAGADAITAINTMPGMLIDAEAGRPLLSNRTGGISGKALKPVALRCVAEIYQAVKIPIIGTGGIVNGIDAIEMIMAGATAVGVGSAVWYHGVDVFEKITRQMEEFMQKHHYTTLDAIRGMIHR